MKVWKNVLSARDFSKDDYLQLFSLARKLKQGKSLVLNKNVALLFFEPSTRTFNSFKIAAEKLGCNVFGFSSKEGTSLLKKESLIDTARMFLNYGADCFVLRHKKAGASLYLAEKIDKPVINAGDDSHEHPTQAMLDLFTIWEKFGKIDGLKIGILGDLRYGRTPSSLAYALLNWKVKLYFIAPETLQIDKRNDDMEYFLEEKKANFEKTSEFKQLLNELDVLYVTRIQRERFPDLTEYEKVKKSYAITKQDLEKVKNNFMVLHPLPRVDELDPSIDESPYAYYFEQAKNGLYVRMALFTLILKNEN
ncbi:aspartate carbamoyltransferase [Candidatus Pacearchaeota archaeon ex4484_31]|nr:MAG: aspartate carbamoyltransferase [Candidatus Pacearchaeota archaeon ex4484_31]